MKVRRMPRGVLLWAPLGYDHHSNTILRLEQLHARVRQIRRNCYPKDWDADPWYSVERELKELIKIIK